MTDVFFSSFFFNLQTQYKDLKKNAFHGPVKITFGIQIYIYHLYVYFIYIYGCTVNSGKNSCCKKKMVSFFFLFTWLWHMVWRGQNLDATERLRWQHHTLKLIKPCLVVKGDPHPSRPEPIKTLANQVRTG